MITQRTRLILGLLAMSLLAACRTPQPEPDPTPGTLAINVSNLPVGVPAPIRVTGPQNYAREVAASQTLAGLAPGEYQVSAASVSSGGLTWFPSAGLQAPTVAPGAAASVSVSYTGVPFAIGLEAVATIPGAVFLTSPPGDRRLFVLERDGRIHILDNGVRLPTPFLDINERVLSQGEGGLLSMAFDPNYASNGFFYVFYTDKLHRVVIERFTVSSDPNRVADGSALAIMRIQKIRLTHNGGLLSFGPDGYLYFAIGDDGGGGDPYRNAQDLSRYPGKVLRIDVSASSSAQRYRVPPTNPFIGVEDAQPEIWAYGLRNPWRHAFDDGLFYLADVGQDEREEVNVVSASQPAVNYGWRIMEGSTCYESATCERSGLTLPVLEYDHGNGCSITGGYVYRGRAIPELTGRYLYSDFCSGFLRSFRYANGAAAEQVDWLITGAGNVLSFGRDALGELYLLNNAGNIFRIVRIPPVLR